MTAGLLLCSVSSALIVFFAGLFYIEAKRGSRLFLSQFRAMLDAFLLRSYDRYSHWSFHFGSAGMRLMFHYIMHRLLGFIIFFLKGIESFFVDIQRSNRRVAKSVRADVQKNHLQHIADHKEEVTPSEEKKQELREKAME